MPVLLVPALFVGGTAVVLGGGYFLLHGLACTSLLGK